MRKSVKKIIGLTFALGLAFALTTQALADYTIAPPKGPIYGEPTSVETVYTPEGGEQPNEYKGKDAALIPPSLGTGGVYPQYALESNTFTPPSVSGNGGVIYPGAVGGEYPHVGQAVTSSPASYFTEVTPGLQYADGSLGTLSIPSIGVNVKIYEGTSAASMAKGAAHFEDTSIWNGNVCLAGHNRGVSEVFGKIHTLNAGDTITLTTKLGTRTYAVASVEKVYETDMSGTGATDWNQLSLYTCVMDERPYRWRVTAIEIEIEEG